MPLNKWQQQSIIFYLDVIYYNAGTDPVISVVKDVLNFIENREGLETAAALNFHSFLVLSFGEYGVSPRFGWFDTGTRAHIIMILKDYLKSKELVKSEEEENERSNGGLLSVVRP